MKLFLFLFFMIFYISCTETPTENVNKCAEVSCSGHGVCGIDLNNDPVCICDSGYYVEGLNCKSLECSPSCSRFQNCNIVDDSPICECKANYVLENNSCIYDCSGIDNTIINSENTGCICKDGYILDGATCIIKPTTCDGVTCSNHGNCVVNNNEVTCECDNGFHLDGLNCIEDDKCLNVSCDDWKSCNSDNGLCELNSNRCDSLSDCSDNKICDSNHNCINESDPCDEVACSGHGECAVSNNQALCACDTGYHADGLSCIINSTEDPCNGISCSNHGECAVSNNQALCICDSGYYVDGLSCIINSSDITSISTIRQSGVADNNYKTIGIVTAIQDTNIWIQEEGSSNDYSGIYVYRAGNFQIGDKVEVEGKYIIYYELSELTNVTVRVQSQGNSIPSFKDVDAVNITNMEPQESMLVNFLNPPFIVTEAPNAGNYYNTKVKDANNKEFKIRGTIYHFYNPSVGARFNRLRGILTYDHGEYKLFPRDESDMSSVNACEGVDCSGHGICTITDNVASCICAYGYHSVGLTCVEDNQDLCNNVSCSDHGECIVRDNTATCSCDLGYHPALLECLEDGNNTLHIRFMAANTTSDNYQAYEDEGIRIFQAIDADIVMVQEFNYEHGSIRSLVDLSFDSTFQYSRGDGDIPNGIISRYTIINYGYWDDPNIPNRDLDWVEIDIPGDKDLFVISVHLKTSPSSAQITAGNIIAKKVAEHRAAHPNEYYYIVGGDFNGTASVSNDGFKSYNGETVLIPGAQYPVGEDGKTGTNASRSKHYDWILTTSDLKQLQVPSRFCAQNSTTDCMTYNNGLVFDTRNFSQTELDKYFSPTRTGDSGASNMQHMGIIKDFEITY